MWGTGSKVKVENCGFSAVYVEVWTSSFPTHYSLNKCLPSFFTSQNAFLKGPVHAPIAAESISPCGHQGLVPGSRCCPHLCRRCPPKIYFLSELPVHNLRRPRTCPLVSDKPLSLTSVKQALGQSVALALQGYLCIDTPCVRARQLSKLNLDCQVQEAE